MFAKVTILGNDGADPEIRYTKTGAMNLSFSVAVNKRRTADGTDKPPTWFKVTAWGKLAETMDRLGQDGLLDKGKQVLVTGRLESSEYKDGAGKPRTSLEVNADDIVVLDRSQASQSNRQSDIEELPF